MYRYQAGKADWSAFGLPMAGWSAALPRAAHAVRLNPPTCDPGEPLGSVRRRAEEAGWNLAAVVNEAGVVLGRISAPEWDEAPDTPVEAVMENGPTTFRPDQPLESLVERMKKRGVASVLITNPDGVLLGVLYREDA